MTPEEHVVIFCRGKPVKVLDFTKVEPPEQRQARKSLLQQLLVVALLKRDNFLWMSCAAGRNVIIPAGQSEGVTQSNECRPPRCDPDRE